MNNFKDLRIWQKGMELSLDIYRVSKKFPKEETYGLTSQIRRATISIPSNIAEGHLRKTKNDFKQFLAIARGSLAELETQLIIAESLKYISEEDYKIIYKKVDDLSKMTASFYSKL